MALQRSIGTTGTIAGGATIAGDRAANGGQAEGAGIIVGAAIGAGDRVANGAVVVTTAGDRATVGGAEAIQEAALGPLLSLRGSPPYMAPVSVASAQPQGARNSWPPRVPDHSATYGSDGPKEDPSRPCT
jgi:hypothetical protein